MGWVSGREPQLGMLITEFKRADGRGLGAKFGECSKERERLTNSTTSNPQPSEEEKIGDVTVPPQTIPKNAFAPKPNHLLNKLDTTPDPPVFPPMTNNFQRRVTFVPGKGEKPREKP